MHPECDSPTCMSCGRDLSPITMWGIVCSVKHHVPDEVDCCSRCWGQVPKHERIKIVIAIRDRQMGGVISLIAAMGEAAILERRTEQR